MGGTVFYKITGPKGEAIHGGTGRWPLPETGKWRSVRGKLVACQRGLHVVTAEQLPPWAALDAVVWEVETAGDVIDAGDKHVARKARLVRKVGTLDRRTLVTFAADCAERVLPIFEKKYPEDDRPRKAIEMLRRWLAGEASESELRAAADAAFDARAYAARAYAAEASRAAAAAAAADAAAADAAYAAASAAAAAYAAASRAKEQEWQGARLLELLAAQ